MQNLKPCIAHPCPNVAMVGESRCAEHARPMFRGTNRKKELPKDWPVRRQIVLRRDNNLCKCGARATEVDHIIPGTDHSLENLVAICTPCHRTKTAHEGNQAQRTGHVQWGTNLMEEYWRREEAKKKAKEEEQ